MTFEHLRFSNSFGSVIRTQDLEPVSITIQHLLHTQVFLLCFSQVCVITEAINSGVAFAGKSGIEDIRVRYRI